MIINEFLIIIFLILFNLSLLINLEKIEKFFNIYDLPNNKLKLHKFKVPILGGVILYLNYFLLIISSLFFGENFVFEFNTSREFLSLLFLTSILFFIGLYDDKFFMSAINKFFFSFLVIILAILINENLSLNKVLFSFYNKYIFLDKISLPFSVLCFLLLINALNFYDGINGQSILNFIIIFLYLFFKSELNFFYLYNILILTFLIYLNIRNKIFLGDSGIYLLSSIVGFCLIYEYNNKSILYADEIFLLLMLPGIDLLRLTFTRIINGKNAFNGDRNHLHHLILKSCSLMKTNVILLTIVIVPLFLLNVLKLPIILCIFSGLLNYFVVFILFKNDNKLKKNRR